MKYFHAAISVLLPATLLLTPAPAARAQSEHASHHPDTAVGTGAPAVAPAGAASAPSGGGMGGMGSGAAGAKPGGMGGMGGGMGEMMKEMTKTPEMPLYPTMMQDPDPGQRSKARQLANERMREGSALLNTGLQRFAEASNGRRQDLGAMQDATEQIRRGQDLLESGLAAQRALAENEDPRAAALQWFNGEMNLTPRFASEQPHGFFGLNWFHYVVMLTLAAFVAAMIWMYFHKMQRANALVAKLTGAPAGSTPAPGVVPPGAPAPGAAVSGVKPASTSPPSAAAAKPVSAPAAAPSAAAAKPVSAPAAAPAAARPGAPSKPNAWTGTLLVSEIFEETPGVKTFRLIDVAGGKIPFVQLPGQFVTLTVRPDGEPVTRSYTIASSPRSPITAKSRLSAKTRAWYRGTCTGWCTWASCCKSWGRPAGSPSPNPTATASCSSRVG